MWGKVLSCFVSVVLLASMSGCAVSNLMSTEAIGGSILGAGLGGFGTSIIDDSAGVEEIATGTGIGLAVGLLGGALINENRTESTTIKSKSKILRVPAVSENLAQQQEIDAVREHLRQSTIYGRGETKPWNKRYRGEESDFPYQGPVSNN